MGLENEATLCRFETLVILLWVWLPQCVLKNKVHIYVVPIPHEINQGMEGSWLEPSCITIVWSAEFQVKISSLFLPIYKQATIALKHSVIIS